MKGLKSMLFLVLMLIPAVQGCSGANSEENKAVFREIPELKAIKPEKPVKIKLKRNAAGDYLWELNGSNADKVLKIDRKLREAFVHEK